MAKATPDGVIVASSARLHMGFLDPSGVLGRRFGSIGLALDGPETRITLRRAAKTRAAGPDCERGARYLEMIARHLGVAAQHELTVISAIDAHAGLGSGTQLALAVAAAMRRLHDMPGDPADDALVLGRGGRSGIGIALFRDGGFVVDGGRGESAGLPPVLVRMAVSSEWRVMLVRDPRYRGLSGDDESAGLAALPAFHAERAATLCHLVLMQVLPALAEDDLPRFGAAITRIQQLVGGYFAPVQGGTIASPRVAAALGMLGSAGATGLGQSSWGPTGFGFVRGEETAHRIAETLRRSGHSDGLDIDIRRPLNRGALVTDME